MEGSALLFFTFAALPVAKIGDGRNPDLVIQALLKLKVLHLLPHVQEHHSFSVGSLRTKLLRKEKESSSGAC